MSEPVAKYGALRIPISRELADDVRASQLWMDELFEGMRRDLAGERRHGPFRTWEWVDERPDYLDALDPIELLSEARRFHAMLAGQVDLERWDPQDPDDVIELRGIARPEWWVR